MRRGRATGGGIAAIVVGAAVLAGAAPAGASEYSEGLARDIEREIVHVDPKAKPKVSTAEAGRIRLRIVRKAFGRLKIGVVPAGRAAEEGGASGLANAVARDLRFKGSLMIVAGSNVYTLTSHPAAEQTADAVREAFDRNKDDRGKAILQSVDAIGAVDPGPSADLNADGGGSPSGLPSDVDDNVDGIFDSINDAIRTTTLVIAAFFLVPIIAFVIWILMRVRSGRKEAAGDIDFAQEGLRNQLIALGDDIRQLEVDTSMPGVNALAVADYEAAVQQYDVANSALERSEGNQRYLGEARAALKEGQRRISDAKVRLGVTPTP